MKRTLLFSVLTALGLWTLLGCASTVRYSPDEIKGYPPDIQQQIQQGNVVAGMTPQQVRYAWGPPTTVNVLAPTQEGKLREEWLYAQSIFVQRRLLFVDGKLFDIFPEPKPAPAPEPQQQPQEQPREPEKR